MNGTQQIFSIFFAIFWSVMANAQPKWKAFHYTFFLRIPQVTHRILTSFLILNILPICYFSWSLNRLNALKDTPNNQFVLHGVIPAFAIFGFYRIWICIMEFFPHFFYRENNNSQYPDFTIEPTIKSLGFPTEDRKRLVDALVNLIFGIIYIGVGIILI